MNDQTFTYHGLVHKYGQYRDFEFTDGNPRRLYVLTFDVQCDSWFGVIRESETDLGEFNDGDQMSMQRVALLRNLIPEETMSRLRGEAMEYNRFARERSNTEGYLEDIEAGQAIAVIWTSYDVHSVAEGRDEELTDEEASEVLYRLKRYHDATIGINWDTIDFHVSEIVRER